MVAIKIQIPQFLLSGFQYCNSSFNVALEGSDSKTEFNINMRHNGKQNGYLM